MATDLVDRLRENHEALRGPDYYEAYTTIEQQAASLAEKDKEIERLQAMCAPETNHPTRNVGLLYQQARAEQAERALAEAVEILTIWSHDGSLQTFEHREKFRKIARAFIAKHGSDSSTER
jgi:predicted O-methyltransferase YrrM